mmetsp:Transcript_26633/g.39505  ORF Transcript_26633/g.39505 Transcript_26633/m.39505 type:complete len:95 (-) Transcript_26633:288-572(-)
MADAAIENLTKRVTALETSSKFSAEQEAVREAQMEMLTKLRAVRETLVAGDAAGASSKELEVLRSENSAHKQQLAKQEYRIMHLLRHLDPEKPK